jgi:ferredoxin
MVSPRTSSVPSDPERFTRRRARVLIAVHALMALHVAHWKLAGKTLAPLEFNEVMHGLELGIVTAGALLMAVALFASAVFGRFFCGWGCHVLALQDLAAAGLSRLGLKPRAVRSRALALVPAGAALYMFAWPSVARAVDGRPAPPLRFAEDADGWASFTTTDFWRNLPGPGVALATFVLCGGVLVAVAGSRGFCRYACPYGALFGLVEKFAVGRIRRTGDCTACAKCTAACTSNIAVHDELRRHGTVLDSRCLRDLDCVAACPSGAVGFRLGAPGLGERFRRLFAKGRRAGLGYGGEALAGAVFLVVLFAWRGLYDAVPFFAALALGVVAALAATTAPRLRRFPDVEFARARLRVKGRLTGVGALFVAVFALGVCATLHAAYVSAYAHLGRRLAAGERPSDERLATAASALARAETSGSTRWPSVEAELGRVEALRAQRAAARGDAAGAVASWAVCVRLRPGDAGLRAEYGTALAEAGNAPAGLRELDFAVRAAPDQAQFRHNRAVVLASVGRLVEAVADAEAAVRLAPDDRDSRRLLARMRELSR